MNQLQLREKEIFDTLAAMKKENFAIIGGYAVNAYALPRFSVDCDIVTNDPEEPDKISKLLIKIGYKKTISNEHESYSGNFSRYEKEIMANFKVSIDMLIGSVLDRQTNVNFSAEWIFKNSKIRGLLGKTITEKIKLRIIDIDALIVMKFISARNTDIRDVFMLVQKAENPEWIKNEISSKCSFDERYNIIYNKITSKEYRNNLQGVYGHIDEKIFQKNIGIITKMQNISA